MVAYARRVAEASVPEKACGVLGSLAAGQLLGRGGELSEEARALLAQWGLLGTSDQASAIAHLPSDVVAVSEEQAADVVGVEFAAESVAAVQDAGEQL